MFYMIKLSLFVLLCILQYNTLLLTLYLLVMLQYFAAEFWATYIYSAENSLKYLLKKLVVKILYLL